MEPIKLESDAVDALAAALAKAQAAFGDVTKDKTGKVQGEGKGGRYEYSYKYADLAAVLDAVRKPLADNQLALVQRPIPALGGLVLETRLIHSSGQWIGSVYPLPDPTGRPQEMGSALTYARRYSLTALLGVAPDEDDDAAAAEDAHAQRRREGEGKSAADDDGPTCPKCGRRARPSKFPKPGATYCCRNEGCKAGGNWFVFDPMMPEDGQAGLFGPADAKAEEIGDPFGRDGMR